MPNPTHKHTEIADELGSIVRPSGSASSSCFCRALNISMLVFVPLSDPNWRDDAVFVCVCVGRSLIHKSPMEIRDAQSDRRGRLPVDFEF